MTINELQRKHHLLSRELRDNPNGPYAWQLRKSCDTLKTTLDNLTKDDRPTTKTEIKTEIKAETKTETPSEQTPTSGKNFAFDQWKVLTSQAGLHLVDRVTKIVLDHEATTRQRTERVRDAANYRKLIHAVTANLVYQDLIHRGSTLLYRLGIHISRSKDALRSKDTFRYNAQFMSKRLCRLLDTLAATDLIVQEVPFKQTSVRKLTKTGRTLSNETVVYPSGQFITLLHQCKVADLYTDVWRFESEEDREEIVIQNSLAIEEDDVANRQHYTDTDVHIRYRYWTRKFNTYLGTISMEVSEPLKASTTTGLRLDLRNRSMKRIFNRGRLTSLGRYYGNTWWLPVSKTERFERVRLNGERVAELDFSSMLVRLAYGLVGSEPPTGDQYSVPGFERSRDAMKILFCARLFQQPGRTKRNNLPKDAIPLFHPAELRDTKTVLAAMDAKHPALVPLVATTVGHDLFFKESQILSEVMAQMLKHSIPFLPVHDAVYCPVSQVEKTQKIMEGMFYGMVGIKGMVRVSRGKEDQKTGS